MALPPEGRGTALLLIDIQQGFDDPGFGRRNNPDAEANAATLVAAWRQAGRPIYHVRHLSQRPESPFAPGKPGSEIQEVVRPEGNEPVVEKRVNSAFIGTDLEQRLRAAGLGALVVAGLTTDHCVSSTARMAGDLGFETYVVSDATATFDRVARDGRSLPAEDVHAVSLASLSGEFATVVATDELLSGLS